MGDTSKNDFTLSSSFYNFVNQLLEYIQARCIKMSSPEPVKGSPESDKLSSSPGSFRPTRFPSNNGIPFLHRRDSSVSVEMVSSSSTRTLSAKMRMSARNIGTSRHSRVPSPRKSEEASIPPKVEIESISERKEVVPDPSHDSEVSCYPSWSTIQVIIVITGFVAIIFTLSFSLPKSSGSSTPTNRHLMTSLYGASLDESGMS